MRLYRVISLVSLCLFCGVFAKAQIDWQDYPYPLDDSYKDAVRFGFLTVPETPSDSSQRKLKIGFCILKSTSESPRKDAVIYLPGGPGQGFTRSAPYFLEGESIRRLLQDRDIILFDPRGCGTSEPQLCYGLENPEIINADFTGISNTEYWQGIEEAMKACRDSLYATGINPDAYGSSDIAGDIEALRVALGYDKWNIRGHSYGTRYGQSVLRQYPDKVRSAILSGVVPARWAYEDRDFYGLVNALRTVIDQCASDAKCATAYPDLENQLTLLLKRLQKEPIILPPGTLGLLPESSIIISPRIVLLGIFQALYIREGFEMLPLMINTVAEGHDWIADALTLALTVDFQLDGDMYHAIRCNDNPGYRYAPGDLSDDSLVTALYPYWQGTYLGTEEELCLNMGIPIDSTEQEAVHSDVPMLIYSGEFDPVTPPYYADSVSRYMTNATTFVVPGRGHDSPVPMSDVMADFIINPGSKPDLSLLNELPSPQFLVDVHLNKGVSSLSVRMAKNDYVSIGLVLGIVAILILGSFLYFSVSIIRALLKPASSATKPVVFLPVWILTCIGTFFLVLAALAMKEAMSRHLYLLVFGLPESWSFLFFLPWFLLIALAICLLSGMSFLRRTKKALPRILWALGCAGSAGLIFWLVSWEVI